MKSTQQSICYLATVTLLAALSIPCQASQNRSFDPTTLNPALSGEQVPFPSRPAHALTGSEFLQKTTTMKAGERERAILAELQAGNVPSHIRKLVPVEVGYQNHRATVYVTPDYLAVGADDDYAIIPMAPRTAMRIARQLGFTLPTKKLVDDIYHHSTLRLAPQPMYPGPRMTSSEYYREHDRRIKSQRSSLQQPARLIAGHKKDLVLTPRLLSQPSRVAIYGWHRQNGQPIQPLSLVHGIEYVDYSHGVRLISRRATVDGLNIDLAKLMSDARLNPLVSDEGQVSVESYL